MNENFPEPIRPTPAKVVAESAPDAIPPRDKMRARIVQGVSFLGLALVLLFLWQLFGSKSNKAANKPRAEVVPVEMTAATQMDVPVQIKSIGNIEALSTIAVRSQVEGTLQG